MTRLSINEMTTFRWTFDEDVEHGVAEGYGALGVWRQKLSDFGEERGVELLAERGLHVSNLSWAGGFTGSDGRTLRESIDDALDAIRLAADLRADCLVVYSGARGGHTHSHARRLFRDSLERLLPAAEKCGVTLAVPVVHAELAGEWSFLSTLSEATEFLGPLDHPQLKLAIDTYHLAYDVATLDTLANVAPRVAIVHLGDGQPPARGEERRSALGDGTVPLREVVAALTRGGYDGYYDLKLIGMEMQTHDYPQLLARSRQVFDDLVVAAHI